MDYALKWYALILKKNVIWNEKGILHIVKCWKRPQSGQNKTGLWRDSTKKKQEATESLSYQAGLVMVRNTSCTILWVFHKEGMGLRVQ